MSQMSWARAVAEVVSAGPEDAEALAAAGLGQAGRYARVAAKGLRTDEAGLIGRIAAAITAPAGELPAGFGRPR